MKKDFAFDRVNYILLAIGMAVVIVGFVLMGGSGSTESEFNPEIFSAMRIKIAPLVCFVGFLSIIVGIMHKPKGGEGKSPL
ncbi:MAG: DUF3098 domain-containing protein [Bacteroidaceae bacterium]|nr:DUF3098 domain-containing protein [Bacteroidaceae bacterium]